MIAVASAGLLVVLAGHGVLRAAGGEPPVRRLGVLGAASLSVLAGVALLAVVTTVIGVLGGPTRPLPVALPLVVVAVAGIVPGWGRPGPRRRPVSRAGDVVTALLAAGIGARLAEAAARVPVISWDEFKMWALRGRVMSLAGHLDPRVFQGRPASSRFPDGYSSPDYPLLVPSLIAWSDGWVGAPLDAPAKLHLAALFVAALGVTGWALGRLAGPVAAACGVLVLAGMPAGLPSLALYLTGDIAVISFTVPLVLVLVLWVRDGDRMHLVAAAALAVGAGSTKNEGLLYAAAALLGAGLAAPPPLRRRLAVAAGVVAAALAPWMVFTRVHGLRNSFVNGDTLAPAHVLDVLPLADDLVAGIAGRWPGSLRLAAAALVLAALCARRRGHGRTVVQLTATLAVIVTGLYVQYLVSIRHPVHYGGAVGWMHAHLESTAWRVLSLPAVLTWIAVVTLAGMALRAAAVWPAIRRPLSPAARPR